MDLGSIEDLLRPASLAERKQRLGLLNGNTVPCTAAAVAPLNGSPSKPGLAAGTIAINHHSSTTDACTSTATGRVSTTTAAVSRSVEKEKPATSTAKNRHCLSPNLKKSKPPTSINKDRNNKSPITAKAQQKKRVRMENRPPLAPKPDSLKESPSHPSPTSSPSPSSAAPVPRPRKKPGAPPPAKPMPYRRHVELKDKEVSTFKSSTPVAPPRVRQRPAVPSAKPSPPSYRLSIPGEPSELFQPKAESKGPVQYAIPQVPKRLQKPPPPSSATTSEVIDSRPRLNTPQVVPDPDNVLDKRGGAESHGTPSNFHPTTTQNSSSTSVNGIAGGHDDELVSHNDEPELYTEAYAHVESEENDAEYAVVSPSRTAIVPTPQSSSSLAAPVATGKSSPSPPRRPPPPVVHGRSSPVPPVAASSRLRRGPSPAPPIPPPPSIQSVPTSHHPPVPSSSSPLRDPSTVDDSIDDHEYNTTSHVKDRVKKRSRATPPPIAPPTSTDGIDDHEYNTTTHVQDRVKKMSRGTPPIPPPTAPPTIRPRSTKSPSPPSAVQVSVGDDEYSMLDRPNKKPVRPIPSAPTVQPSSESDEYSVLNSEPDEKRPPQVSEFEEYSVLNGEPQATVPSTSCTTAEAEGYSHLDLNAIAAASSVAGSGEDASVYEEIRSESPVKDDTKKAGSTSSSFGPSPSPPVLPQMDKHPRALARKASDKFKDEDIEATVLSSRDRSKFPAYQQPSMEKEEKEDGTRVKERGGARLPPRNRAPPPVPHPKQRQKIPGEAASTPTNHNASEPANVGSSNSKAAVPLNVLETAGYETRNTFSPEVEKKERELPQRKPPTPNRRISPVPPAKARGSKPPPRPKPKQISPPTPRRAVKVATSGEQGPTKGRESTPPATTEGQSTDYEPICTPGDSEAVDGSHDSHVTGVPVSSPKVELDIDHITRVGGALADYDLQNMAEALYDNQMVVDAVSLGGDSTSTSSSEQQKRASRTSYENQVVVDMVQSGNNRNSGAADGTMEGDDGSQGSREQNLHRTSHGAEMEVSENRIVESANGGDDACTKLTPSDVFTVPQHAVPGHLGYCDVNVSHTVKNASPSEHQAIALAQNQHLDGETKEGGGVDSGTFVVQPHAYPDSQGYCDFEVQQSPAAATQPGPIVVETADGGEGGDDSGTFIVQPHAYPDSHGYCDIEIQQSPAAATQPGPIVVGTADGVGEGEGGGVKDDSGTFVVQPHAYPDSHGYCDIEVKQPPPSSHSSTAAQPDSDANSAKTATVAAAAVVNVEAADDEVVTNARDFCNIDIRPLPPPANDKPQVKSSEVIKTDAQGYCDIDILSPPSSGESPGPAPSPAKDSDAAKDPSTTTDDVVMDAQGYCDIDIKTPPPKSTSHKYEMVPESAEQNSTSSKGGSKSVSPPSAGNKAPPVPLTRPTKPGSKSVQDKESGESSNKKGVPPKRPPPRRRAPPPPPLKAKTVDEPSENSPQSSPLKKELVISTGLATLPRSPKKQPPRPPPPFASTNSPLLSKKMSPLVGKKLDLSSSSPQSSHLPLGSPNEQPQSSGIKKKFKGLFTKPKTGSSATNATSEPPSAAAGSSSSSGGGGLARRPSWGRRKKGKAKNDTPSPQDGGELSPSMKARSLPGYALHRSQGGAGPSPPKLQLQCSYDADQEDDGEEFGIYSTIQEDKLKPGSAEGEVVVGGAAAAAAAVVDDLKDNGDMDEGGYDVVDKKPRSVSINKKKKKSGKKGFEMRKASSVEHLYETADFDNDVKMPKSARNSPRVPRKPPQLGDHAPGPALPLPNRNFLPGPPNLNELKEGVDPSQLYAQVVASPKQPQKKRRSNDLSEKESSDRDSTGMVLENSLSTGTEGAVAVADAVTGGVPNVEGDRVPEQQQKEKVSLVASLLDQSPSPEHVAAADIEHKMEGEDAYAVVSAELKENARKRRLKSTESDRTDNTAPPPPPTVSGSGEAGSSTTPRGRNPGKKAPPKPPKSYQEHVSSSPSGRVSPMLMFAKNAAAQEKAESGNRSPQAVVAGGATSSPRNLSPPPVDVALGLTPQERTRVASFSSGPPSFPPPPPPKSASPEPIVENEGAENPYNTVDEVKSLKPKRKAPPAPGGRRPPPPRTQNGSLGEDEPGCEMVKNDKKAGRKKGDKDKSSMVHIDKVSKPHLSPNQRAPHVYTTFEVVEDESGEMKGKEGSITVPVKTPAAGYATVSSSKRATLPTSLTKRDTPQQQQSPPGRLFNKNPKLTPKARPPPPPPGQRRPGDSSTLPLTSSSSGSGGHHPRSKQLASPMTGDSPSSSVAEDQIGKRIFVSMENSPTPDSAAGPGVAEPKFLFSHAQKFIEVGDADNIPPAPVPVAVVTNSYEEEDSDGDVLDSTDWETSSGGEEEAEEQERERSPEPKEAQPKTFYIAREILTTERTFVKGLTLIDRDFRQAMRSANNAHEKPVITEDGLKTILGNVSSLLTLNSGLLQELEERMAQWSTNPRIGDILLSRAPYLKLYTEYISKFDKALKTLEEFTKKNPVFAQVLKEFECQPKCANIPLAGYMLDIVQRITRYKLLLADYVKHLPDDSPDKDTSQKALVIISSVATHVNETVRQMDNFRKVCDVRKKLIGDSGDTLITPHRKLLKEGELMKFSRKEKQPRMFFLFNDILIYASSIPPANTTYKVIKRIPLDGMRVERLDDPEMRYGFQIISTCKSFRLEASNREELHQWMTAFEVAIKENSDRKKLAEPKEVEETDSSIPLGSLAPPWLPDSAVSMCQLCSTHFTVTRRRHHCRACGKIFCSDCSSYLAPLKYKGNKLGRVCQVCYEKLPKNEDTMASKRTSLQRTTKSRVSLPSVLKEVKARDQSAQVSGYLQARNSKSRRWKKRWFVVYNLVLYEFERHEDVSAKRSITLPSYQVARHEGDPLVFVLNHPGTGKEYFKEDSPEQVDRWIEVLQKAVLGEIEEEEEPAEEGGAKKGAELRDEEEEDDDDDDDEDETGEESSPSHHPPLDTPSDTTSEAGQSPSKESSLSQLEQSHPVIMEGDDGETNS